MRITDLFERKQIKRQRNVAGPKHFRTTLKGRNGERLASGYSETQETSDAALLEMIRDRFSGDYTPLYLHFRGRVVIAWRDGSDWCYGHVLEKSEPTSITMSDWKSRNE